MKRSQFYAQAARHYLDALSRDDRTSAMSEAIEASGARAVDEARSVARDSTAAIGRVLEDEEW